MSDNNNKSDHEFGYGDLVFDSEIRSTLAKKLNKAITSQNQFLSAEDIHSKVNEVIDSIEIISNSIGFYRKFRIEKQHRRKERLESIANHLDGIIDQLTALDQSAIIYVLSAVWSAPPPHIEKCSPLVISNCADNAAFDISSLGSDSDIIRELSAYALNIRKAAVTLPRCIGDKPGAATYERSIERPELGMAIQLENLFYEHGIKFTITDTGLAAECLRAIYELSGLKINRVDYWLKCARDHERASKNFLYSLRSQKQRKNQEK